MPQNTTWEDELLQIHYEPGHAEGGVCWCNPTRDVRDGVLHIEHNEQRVILKEFIERIRTEAIEKDRIRSFAEMRFAIEGMKIKPDNESEREIAEAATKCLLPEVKKALIRTLSVVLHITSNEN